MSAAQVPSHVPGDIVRDFDIYFKPGSKDTWQELSNLHDNYPDVFWNTKGDPLVTKNGTWVVTRKELIKEVTQNPKVFSSQKMVGYSQSIGEDWDLIPLEVDPPEHIYYRLILNKEMSPKAINPLVPRIREYAQELIKGFLHDGETDFVSSFGTRFPIGIFFELTGLPKEHLSEFYSWVHTLTHTYDDEPRKMAIRNIRRVMAEQAEDRRLNPRDDLISRVVHAEVDGRKLTEEEITGMLFLLFVGGQDTVTATLGNIFKYLADHPEVRQKLRNASEQEMTNAIEELLRIFSVVVGKRRLVKDVELGGVSMREGDYVTLIYALGSLDPQAVECPMHADFDRSPNPHIAFAFGPHRCVGSNLVRQELRIAITEWLKLIPDFEVKPGAELLSHSGIYGYENLPLVWSA